MCWPLPSSGEAFQFLYGAIKSDFIPYHSHYHDKFQFLYGAIKSWPSSVIGGAAILFQFLYGAIKRIETPQNTPDEIYFNSSMVRLKVMKGFNVPGIERTFQFLYGAIKSGTPTSILSRKKLFQFLYGAIKRRYAKKARRWDIYFNSSMVRLKGILTTKKDINGSISIPLWCD